MSIETYAGREPVTGRRQYRPWSTDLETPRHAEDSRLFVDEALAAIEQTRRGVFVDLVTHERHGNPSNYLYSEVRSIDRAVTISAAGRYPCGGFVSKVAISASDPST